MKKIKERINNWVKDKKITPLTAELHLTNKCNLKCLSCWQRGQFVDIQNEISVKEWKAIVDEIINLKIKEIYLGGGGEPMCRKNLVFYIMGKVKEHNARGLMTTNLTLFDEKDIIKTIDLCWDHIQISIDATDSETNDYLRGKGAYQKNIESLKLFNKWKKKLKKSKPDISLHTVISNKNYNTLKDMIKLAHKLKIKEVNLQPLVIQNDNCKNLKLNSNQEGELQEELKKSLELAKDKGITTNFENLIKKDVKKSIEEKKNIQCFEPWDRITIMSDGQVKTCCNPSKISENAKNKSLEKIWNGRKFNKIRKKFYKGKLMKECCTHPNKRL